MPTDSSLPLDVQTILRALAGRKNVIITGPPGTGKSRLLNQVRAAFVWRQGQTGADPRAEVPLPPEASPMPEWFPSPSQDLDRKVFQTVFDQNTKYRDFMRGLVPKVGTAGEFEVTSGTLYRAAQHANGGGHAALVIVDEVNRGPAVAAFGSALVGLEPDKRLPSDGEATESTQYFEILGTEGTNESFALPNDLYILAAMNEADTSVEPLDVAFLRRFHIHRLEPQPEVLRKHFNLPDMPQALPATPGAPDYYEALVQAFVKINHQIVLGRGPAYQIGHGALMHASPSDGVEGARDYLASAWATLRAHLDEVFFGNTRAISDVLRAETTKSPYSIEEATFAGQTVRRITGPVRPTIVELYELFSLIATG